VWPRSLGLVAGAVAYGAAIVFVRGEPRWNGDQGVFLSIAARVLDGDRLYADVIDNKDPLFFYAHAAALWIGGWKGPAALDGLWLGLAALSIALLLRALDAPGVAVLAGFLLYPLALTASWYNPGLSMLGGLALAPLVGWLWLSRRFVLAGSMLAIVGLFKITVGLVAVAPLVALLVLGAPGGARTRHALRGGAGFGAALGAAALVLALRGELVRYLDVLSFNVRYPDAARRVQGGSGGVESHLAVVRQFFVSSGRWQWPLALAAVVALVTVTAALWRRGGRPFRELASVSLATTGAAVLTLALTAIWVHHLQMLALAATLVAALLISAACVVRGRRAGVIVAVLLVALGFWGSMKQEKGAWPPGKAWSSARSSVGADLLENARLRYYGSSDRVPYAVLGSNSENAHAVFIDDTFDLECRWFHLYPNNAPEHLEETLDCVRETRPDLVLVTVGFFEPRGEVPDWNGFVAGARDLLESEYAKVADQDMFQVWRRRSA
jgi:hypothetical protein